MSELPRASQIVALHDERLGQPLQPPAAPSALWEAIESNHFHNRTLWAEEDLARRRNVPDADIAANKRAIDAANQKRNDAIERLDEQFVLHFKDVPAGKSARQHSETAGAMIDRLSILSLKIHHMGLQTQRTDVDAAHIEMCRQRLRILNEQRADLAACFDRLLGEIGRGEAYFKVYRQFKMYNDPRLNPALYRNGGKNTSP